MNYTTTIMAGAMLAAGTLLNVGVAHAGEFNTARDGDFTFEWRVDGDELEARISAPTTGYVSVGFEPRRMMQDAEIVIGYVANGELQIRHDYGVSPTAHRAIEDLGGESRVTGLDGTEEDGVTTLHFRLPLSSGGDFDRPLTPGSETTIIWAYGPDGANNFGDYHSRSRGTLTVEL